MTLQHLKYVQRLAGRHYVPERLPERVYPRVRQHAQLVWLTLPQHDGESELRAFHRRDTG